MVPRILIVEDDPVLRKHLVRLFVARGYQVTSAATHAEALAALAHSQIENLLLDLKLPDGDGLSLLSELGEHSGRGRAVLMTAYCTSETAEEAHRLNVHVVRKPLDVLQLLTIFPGAASRG